MAERFSTDRNRITSRLSCWRDTVNYFREEHAKLATQGKDYRVHMSPSVKYAVLPEKTLACEYAYDKTTIRIIQNDVIDSALLLKSRGYKPLLLNNADTHRPGGCVETGSGAQEECCFRRSNYFVHLKRASYPLQDSEVVYSHQVKYIKDSFLNYLPKPIEVDCVACAAFHGPKTRPNVKTGEDEFSVPEDREIMKEKIKMIFKAGYKHGNDVLVVSAFGCGAYKCPPADVAELFKEVIHEYDGMYRLVLFSILGNPDPVYTVIGGGNYPIFKKVLESTTTPDTRDTRIHDTPDTPNTETSSAAFPFPPVLQTPSVTQLPQAKEELPRVKKQAPRSKKKLQPNFKKSRGTKKSHLKKSHSKRKTKRVIELTI